MTRFHYVIVQIRLGHLDEGVGPNVAKMVSICKQTTITVAPISSSYSMTIFYSKMSLPSTWWLAVPV